VSDSFKSRFFQIFECLKMEEEEKKKVLGGVKLGDEERIEYEEQFIQAVNFLSFELERARDELERARNELKEMKERNEVEVRRNEKLRTEEEIMKKRSALEVRRNETLRTEMEEMKERLERKCRDEVEEKLKQTTRKSSLSDCMSGKTMGTWINVQEDPDYFYGVYFVFGTLQMILSERVRNDCQGIAMVNSVASGGAAETCGIRSGDIVYSINDTNVLKSSFCNVVKLMRIYSESGSYVLVLRRRRKGNSFENIRKSGKIFTSDGNATSSSCVAKFPI
jgi:C-terminal processing protease CtpA/Prc